MKTSTKLIWGLLVLQLTLHIVYTIKIMGLEESKFQCERERTQDLTTLMKGYNELADYEKAYQRIEKKMEQRKTILVRE